MHMLGPHRRGTESEALRLRTSHLYFSENPGIPTHTKAEGGSLSPETVLSLTIQLHCSSHLEMEDSKDKNQRKIKELCACASSLECTIAGVEIFFFSFLSSEELEMEGGI